MSRQKDNGRLRFVVINQEYSEADKERQRLEEQIRLTETNGTVDKVRLAELRRLLADVTERVKRLREEYDRAEKPKAKKKS